jgi:methylenetetrahydrofolate dehydrogenase (NADP+) / methenyltetrahydrofolate cyclohydrolase
MAIIDGKEIARQIKTEIAAEVTTILDSGKEVPHLAAVLVGDNPASHTYVGGKEKACLEVGIISSVYKLSESVSEKELLEVIDYLNLDDHVDGFIVQLPLPKQIDEKKMISHINPAKDVDGFHPENFGRMALNLPAYIPATPFGILQLIERYKIETSGKNCVVLGRSHIVGSPMSILLSRKTYPGDATVTLCHSRTPNLKEITLNADILIVAMGQPEFITKDMVKKGSVVIDVGIHRIPSESSKSGFKLIGDVKFDEVSRNASYITPVPGGVGPMTIVALLMNTLKAYKKEIYF